MSCTITSTQKNKFMGVASPSAFWFLALFVCCCAYAFGTTSAFPDSPDQTVNVEEMATGETKSAGQDHSQPPKIEAQHDSPFMFVGPGGRFNQQPFVGYGGMAAYGPATYGSGQDAGAVNFDFNCKCSAKSNLAKTLLPVPSDVNAAAQQQVQQLQEQVRRLQEQINRATAGKSSFEQFAQMLAQADGLDCSCSGTSSPLSNLNGSSNSRGNSGFGSNTMLPYGQPMTGNPFGAGYPGAGRFIPQNVYGGQSPYGGAVFTPMNKS